MTHQLIQLEMKLIFILMAFAFVMPYQLEDESEPAVHQDYQAIDIIDYLKRIELRQKKTIKILRNIEYFILSMDEPQLTYEKPEVEIVNKRKVNQKEMAISSILNKIKSNG
jgi:hypothetical protein